MADGLRQVGVLLLDGFQDLAAGAGSRRFSIFGHGAHAAVGFAAEFAQGLQFLADHGGDLEDDFRRDLVQAGHALGHVRAHARPAARSAAPPPARLEVREHQRDGLRVLVVDELGELLRVGLLDGVEGSRIGAQRFGQAVQQALGDSGLKARVSSLRANSMPPRAT